MAYKLLHELTAREFDELAEILGDPDTAQWLGGGRAYTRARLEELREFSRADDVLPWTTRQYAYWGIISENHLVGIIGVHPVPPLTGARVARNALQVMAAIHPRERGRGHMARALTHLLAHFHQVAPRRPLIVLIRAMNERAIRAFSAHPSLARGRDVAIGRERAAFFRVI